MINRRLTSAEAAARLGVKPATLYAYVSRGVLSRWHTPTGSTFDPQEIARLARSSRRRASDGPVSPAGVDGAGVDWAGVDGAGVDGAGVDGEGGAVGPGATGGSGVRTRRTRSRQDEPNDPVFVTELTLIDGQHLYYRGRDAVELSRFRSFEAVAGWLWTGEWPADREPWLAPRAATKPVSGVLRSVGTANLPVEKFMVATAAAALTDQLRHDLSRRAVPIVGRGLLATLVDCLPRVPPAARPARRLGRSLSARLWPRLSPLPLTAGRRGVLEAALVLSADHELAPSTLAARVAAAFRADPYAVVSTGLGPASGSWRSGSSGAPSEVERLLAEAQTADPERAIGARLRRTGAAVHGFGMPLYPGGDPAGPSC